MILVMIGVIICVGVIGALYLDDNGKTPFVG